MPNPYLDPYDPNKWGTGIGTVLGGVVGGPIGAGLGGLIGSKFGGKSNVINVNQDDLTPAPFANGLGSYTIPPPPQSTNTSGWNFGTGSGPDASNDGSNFWSPGGMQYQGMGGDMFAAGNSYAPNRPFGFGMKTKLGMLNGDPADFGDFAVPHGSVPANGNTPATPTTNPFLSGPAASDYSSLYRNPAPRPQQSPFKFF